MSTVKAHERSNNTFKKEEKSSALRKPLKIRVGAETADQLVMMNKPESTEMKRVANERNDGGILLNKPMRISSRIPMERINSGIKELIPFVISSNDTDNSVTISTDLRLSFFLH